jgi:hypothetical protein
MTTTAIKRASRESKSEFPETKTKIPAATGMRQTKSIAQVVHIREANVATERPDSCLFPPDGRSVDGVG